MKYLLKEFMILSSNIMLNMNTFVKVKQYSSYDLNPETPITLI